MIIIYFVLHRGIEQQVARRAHNPKVTGSSPVPATTNPFRNGGFFYAVYSRYKGFKRVLLSVNTVNILTFVLISNKVRNQIYTKLTVKTAETDSKIGSKKPKKSN